VAYYRQTNRQKDRTDITTELYIASFALQARTQKQVKVLKAGHAHKTTVCFAIRHMKNRNAKQHEGVHTCVDGGNASAATSIIIICFFFRVVFAQLVTSVSCSRLKLLSFIATHAQSVCLQNTTKQHQ